MNVVKWERFKFILIIVLVFTSLIQVGILWKYQNTGFPNYFLGDLFGDDSRYSPSELNEFKEDLFLPFRVIVSEGVDYSHWMIGRNDDIYIKLVRDLKFYIAYIMTNKTIKSTSKPLTEDILGELICKTSITYDFKANIDASLMPWFINSPSISIDNKDVLGIKRVIILPDSDNDSILIDIVDESSNKIFEYRVPFKYSAGKDNEYYRKLITILSKNQVYPSYHISKELNLNEKTFKGMEFRNDILFAVGQSKLSTFKDLYCSSPEEFNIENKDNFEKIKSLGKLVLKDEADSCIPNLDRNGNATFKNIGNAYTIHEDGLFEYSYISLGSSMEKGEVDDAFEIVADYIGNRKHLIKGASLFLSGIYENKDSYKFTFDYFVDQTPVYFSFKVKEKQTPILNHAITIEATGKRILNFDWIIKNFQSSTVEKEYSLDFSDMSLSLEQNEYALKSLKGLQIKNMYPCFEVNENKEDVVIEPSWLIEPVSDNPYTFKIPKKKSLTN